MVGALFGSGASIVGGLIKSGRAKKEEARIQKQIDNFKRQKLTNVAEGLQVSTLGADIATQQSNLFSSSALDALQKGGSRALLGGIGGVQQRSNQVGQQVQSQLDIRQKEIDTIRANDEARIRATRENREIADLEGLGTALNASRQDRAAGTSDIFSGIAGAAGALAGGGVFDGLFGGRPKNLQPVSELPPSSGIVI